MFDESISFVSGGLRFTLRGAVDGPHGITMKHTLGGGELTWWYVKQ